MIEKTRKVRMNVSISGEANPANGLPRAFNFAPGDIVTISSSLGQKWIRAGHATAAEDAAQESRLDPIGPDQIAGQHCTHCAALAATVRQLANEAPEFLCVAHAAM